jgi:pimeloyl-ACP methyl ester carboxylesterase
MGLDDPRDTTHPRAGCFWAGRGDERLFVRMQGPTVAPCVLFVHGWPQTGRAWSGIAAQLAGDLRCLMPDLRGFGDSARPPTGYGMDTLAADLRTVLDTAGVRRAVVVAHDLGGPAAWALAHAAPDRIAAVAFIETPFPGAPLPGADQLVLRFPHLLFHADVDLATWLIAGREERYLDQFIRHFAGNPDAATAGLPVWAAGLAQPGGLRSSLEHYRVWPDNARRGATLAATSLACPVIAWGGALSMGDYVLAAARTIATEVRGGTLADTGHWIPEERPDAIIAAVHDLVSHL